MRDTAMPAGDKPSLSTLTPLTIGVPYRDEGQSYELLRGGLLSALESLPSSIPRELIICVNGSRPGFFEELAQRVAGDDFRSHHVRVITSAEGKLAAQRAIERERILKGYIAFVDSDVVLDKSVLHRLWSLLESDASCMIAYGQPVPVFPERLGFIHRLTRTHYALRERAYQRAYFHGRAFMLRNWFFDEPQGHYPVSPALARRLKLDRGPLVDDIAMSRMAVARWGVGAIREVPAANVYFDPPDDLRGLYAGALRVAIELQRLDILYPHHAHLQRTLFGKAGKRGGLKRFSRRLRVMHASHRLLDVAVKATARFHAHLIRVGLLSVDTLWIRVPGTKDFARHRKSWKRFKKVAAESHPHRQDNAKELQQ